MLLDKLFKIYGCLNFNLRKYELFLKIRVNVWPELENSSGVPVSFLYDGRWFVSTTVTSTPVCFQPDYLSYTEHDFLR